MPALPKTLTEIRELAAKTFADFPLANAIGIEVVWGQVTVYRDGRIVDGLVED